MSLGWSVKEAAENLKRLLKEKARLQEEIKKLNVNPYGNGIPTKYIELVDQLKATEQNIIQVREWYNLHLFESLESSSERLEWLTYALIGLTVVLIVLTGLTLVR